MARKVVLVADPGIDGASRCWHCRLRLEVLGIAAAGNVAAKQATQNVQNRRTGRSAEVPRPPPVDCVRLMAPACTVRRSRRRQFPCAQLTVRIPARS